MAIEFLFSVPDKPGEMAKVSSTLGDAGINIDAIAGLSSVNQNFNISLITNNPDSAANALNSAGIQFRQNEVLLINLQNQPGEVGKLSKVLGDAGVNITSFYITGNQQQVLGTDNMDKTKQIANDLGLL